MDTSNNLYHDLNSLNQLRLQSKTSQRETLRSAVKEFEAYFLNLMLKNMRQTNKLFSEDNPLTSNDVEFYNDMHDQQLALELSRSSKFGIGDLLFRQLSKHLPKDGGEKDLPLIRLSEQPVNNKSTHSNTYSLKHGQSSDWRVTGHDKRLFNEARLYEVDSETIANNSNKSTNNYSNSIGQSSGYKASDKQSSLPLVGDTDAESKPAIDASIANKKHSFNPNDRKKAIHNPGVEQSASLLSNRQNLFTSKQEFIDTLKPYAIKAGQLLGVNPGVLIAQAALETGWGMHLPKNEEGKPSLNLFGIKADARWSGDTVRTTTLEFFEGIPEKLTQAFRAYSSIQESFDDYVNFLKANPRYQPALEKATNPKEYLKEIQNRGYATDPDYAEKIHAIFVREGLFQLSD